MVDDVGRRRVGGGGGGGGVSRQSAHLPLDELTTLVSRHCHRPDHAHREPHGNRHALRRHLDLRLHVHTYTHTRSWMWRLAYGSVRRRTVPRVAAIHRSTHCVSPRASLFRRFTDTNVYIRNRFWLKYGKLAAKYLWIYGYF